MEKGGSPRYFVPWDTGYGGGKMLLFSVLYNKIIAIYLKKNAAKVDFFPHIGKSQFLF